MVDRSIRVHSVRILIFLVTGLLATLGWDWSILKPLKLLIVLTHEIWHGLAALLAGARLEEIAIHLQEAGETHVTGLNSRLGFILAVSAGYTGLAFTGALFLNRGLLGRFERSTLFLFTAILFSMCSLFAGPSQTAYLIGLGWTLVFLLPLLLGRTVSRYTLIVLGTLFIWYCVYDMFDFTGDITKTDAGVLARFLIRGGFLISGPLAEPAVAATMISIVWCLLMTGMIYLFLRPIVAGKDERDFIDEEPEPDMENPFPADIPPEVLHWLLANGIPPESIGEKDALLELPADRLPALCPEEKQHQSQ